MVAGKRRQEQPIGGENASLTFGCPGRRDDPPADSDEAAGTSERLSMCRRRAARPSARSAGRAIAQPGRHPPGWYAPPPMGAPASHRRGLLFLTVFLDVAGFGMIL